MIKVNTINDLNTIYKNEISVVLAKTASCSVCNAIKDKLQLVSKGYPSIPFYEIYIEDFPEFRGQFLIFTVPTVIVLKKEQEILRESRFVNIKNIKNLLDNI